MKLNLILISVNYNELRNYRQAIAISKESDKMMGLMQAVF
jgi:hypothetical protein